MQLSVVPHLTIYGDVKESDVKKSGIIRKGLENVGLLENETKKIGAESKEVLAEVKSDLMKMPEVRADLMKASG